MKTFRTILTLLTFALLTISCSSSGDDEAEPVTKVEPVTYKEENPLDAYLAGSGFNQYAVDQINSAFTFELGFSFKPAVAGKINSIVVKIPDVNTALRVTLWDVTAKTVMKSELVSVPTANVTVEKAITPIMLIKDKEYLITVKSNDCVRRARIDGSATVYPIVAGNIIITGFSIFDVSSPSLPEFTYPTDNLYNSYRGDVTFKFQQTE
jgi:hypothetical protein